MTPDGHGELVKVHRAAGAPRPTIHWPTCTGRIRSWTTSQTQLMLRPSGQAPERSDRDRHRVAASLTSPVPSCRRGCRPTRHDPVRRTHRNEAATGRNCASLIEHTLAGEDRSVVPPSPIHPCSVQPPAGDAPGLAPRAGVVATGGQLDRVGEPLDRQRPVGRGGPRRAHAELAEVVVAPAGDRAASSAGACVRPAGDDLHGVAHAGHGDRSRHAGSVAGGLTGLVVAPAPDAPRPPDQGAGMVVAGHDLPGSGHAGDR